MAEESVIQGARGGARRAVTLRLSARDAEILGEAVNEAISAQTFYVQQFHDPEDERSDAEIMRARSRFERLQAKLTAQGI